MKIPNIALSAGLVCAATLIVLTAAFSTAQVKAPPIGIARLADGSVRTLFGLPENVVVDKHNLGSFDAASFSDQAGLVAKGGRIQLVNTIFTALGEYESGEQQPLLNVDGGASSAIAWLPASQSILFWNGESFVAKVVNGLDGSLQATAVRVANGKRTQLLLTNAQGAVFEASIAMETGNVVSLRSLPGITGAAFWQGSNIFFRDANGLAVMSANGAVRTVGAVGTGALAFDHIASNWLLVTSRSENRMWALHVNGDQVAMSEVPVPAVAAPEVTK
jgi:hypothetical protein